MPARSVHLPDTLPEPLREGLQRLQSELQVPQEFPPEVLAAADQAVRNPRLPDTDLTDIEFVTIDPEGSMDLDQALHISRQGDGYLVRYAIADVAAFVSPGDPIDLEAHRRGQTFYAPHQRTPLHPPAMSEAAASLLPDKDTPALVWQIALDAEGQGGEARVERAMVRSRAKLTYAGVQADLDAGRAPESLQLLKEVGQLREQVEIERGGVNLNIPEQEVEADGDRWRLTFRSLLPVEAWNAQISLLTGIGAAQLMLYAQVGILRTLPPADNASLRRLRQSAKGLGIAWPAEMAYPDFIRSLDPNNPRHAAMMHESTLLFRGAAYTPFTGSIPEQVEHAALATEYAHVTAPLRRLVDRYAEEICVSICADAEVPAWVLEALDQLPEEMRDSDRRAKAYERGVVDLVETMVLQPLQDRTFEGTVVDLDEKDRTKGVVLIQDPAISAPVRGDRLQLGASVRVRLETSDSVSGKSSFRQV